MVRFCQKIQKFLYFLIEEALKNKGYEMPKIIYKHIRKANILDRITDSAREIAKKCADSS